MYFYIMSNLLVLPLNQIFPDLLSKGMGSIKNLLILIDLFSSKKLSISDRYVNITDPKINL